MTAKQETIKPLITKDYWEKRLRDRWGLHGVGHISYGVHFNKWLYRVRRHVVTRELKKLGLDANQVSVLDVGSGTGFWIDVWKSQGVRSVTASDLTDIAVKRLRQSYPGTEVRQFNIVDSASANTISARYDVISAIDVLFHITKDDEFEAGISNLAKLLRPGGVFIFSDLFVHGQTSYGETQVNRSLEFVNQTLAQNDLHVIKKTPMFVLMNPPLDCSIPLYKQLWSAAMLPVRFVHALGLVYGAVLYPVELLLTRLVRESPSTELMICRKGKETR